MNDQREELLADVQIGKEAESLLGSVIVKTVLVEPLEDLRRRIADLPPQSAAEFAALAGRRDGLQGVVSALESLVITGKTAEGVLDGKTPPDAQKSRIC